MEAADKDEIQYLKENGALGKRAPSASLLDGPSMIILLRAFGKEIIAERLRLGLTDMVNKSDDSLRVTLPALTNSDVKDSDPGRRSFRCFGNDFAFLGGHSRPRRKRKSPDPKNCNMKGPVCTLNQGLDALVAALESQPGKKGAACSQEAGKCINVKTEPLMAISPTHTTSVNSSNIPEMDESIASQIKPARFEPFSPSARSSLSFAAGAGLAPCTLGP